MSNKTYIGLHPNNLNRTEYGQVVLYVEGEPVAFFSGSGDVVISGSLAIEGITNVSASIAAAIATDTGSFMLTGSVNNDTITFTQGDGTTFEIIINNVTSSLTASYVENAQTASYVETAQTASYVLNAVTASYVQNAESASYALFAENASSASYVLNAESASYAATASSANDFLVRGDLTVEGIVTAEQFHTEYVSSSIIYTSGSTKFGDTADDNHAFTGSLNVTGNVSASDTYINDWGSLSASLASIDTAAGGIPTLQQVTDQGSTTTNSITIENGTLGGYGLSVIGNTDYPLFVSSSNLPGDPYLKIGGEGIISVDSHTSKFTLYVSTDGGSTLYRSFEARTTGIYSTGSVSAGGDINAGERLSIGIVDNSSLDLDKFLVLDTNGEVMYRTGAQLASDISANLTTPTLAQVLTAGNTSPLGLSAGPITGSSIKSDGIGYFSGKVTAGGGLVLGTVNVPNAGEDTDKFLVLDSVGNVEYRTGAEVLSDIGALTAANITLDSVTTTGNTTTNSIQVGQISGSELRLSNVIQSGVDTDRFLVYSPSASGTVLYRTGAQVLSDIGGASAASINLQSVTNNGNNTTHPITASALNITTNAEIAGNLVVGGRITAEEFHTEFVSASIIYQSGSTKFGNSADDKHAFTGSINLTGNISSSDSYINDWGSISASLSTLQSSAGVSTLQDVTDNGNTTTLSITASGANLTSVANAGTDTDKFLVLGSNGSVQFRTGDEIATDIGAATQSFDGNRAITQPLLPDLVDYNPGTSDIATFLEQVFYPDPGFGIEILTNEPFYILESELSSSFVRGATVSGTPVGNYYYQYGTASFEANTDVSWSLQTNSVLDIHPNTGELFIKINLSGSATYQAPKTIAGTVTANATSGGYKTRNFTVTVIDNSGPTISTNDISNYSPKAASFVTASGAYIGSVYINEQADPKGPPVIDTFGGSHLSLFSSSLTSQLAGASYYDIHTTQALNSGSYLLNFTGSDLYGNETSASVTLVINANTAPILTVYSGFNGNITNYSTGDTYGQITVTDNQGDAIDTFTLSGPDASNFTVQRVSSNMGALSTRGQGSGTGTERWAVKFATAPPFTGTYNITASATDNFAFTGSLAIPNTLSANFPSLPSPNAAFFVIESALTGDSVTTATSGIAGTAATMTTDQPVSWSLSDDLSGKLTISGSTVGYITLQGDLSGSSYQNGSTLSATVTATNVYNLSKSNNITVTVTDNVGASISPNLSFLNNYYTKDGATSFGNILVFDPQSIENVQLVSIGGPDGDKFTFVSQSAGQSVLYPFSSSQALNSGSYIVDVTASDSYGQFTSQSFTISVFANNPPVIGLYSGSSTVTSYQPDIAQAVSGSTLGYVQANDGDSGIDGIVSFNFTGSDAAKFDAVFNGQVGNEYIYLIKTAESLAQGSYNLTGSAVDGFGFTTNKAIPVTVTVQAPTVSGNGPYSVIESAVSGALVYGAGGTGYSGTQAQITATQTVTWSVTGIGSYLAIDSDGKLSVETSISGSAKQYPGQIDAEVVATNTSGVTKSLPIVVSIVDDLDPVITNTLVNKNNNRTTAATGFGTITISDPQSLGNVSLTDFNGPDVGNFTFTPGAVGSTRVYAVSSSAALNSGSYSFSVTGSDAYYQEAKQSYTITVLENLTPTVTLTGFTKDVSEATNGATVGSASIVDPQDDSIVSFTLSGTDSSKFNTTLASSTATTALYAVSTTEDLATGSYNLTGSATDSFGLTTVTPIPVNISLASPDVPIKNAVNFYVIESALSGALVYVSESGYSGVQADMNTNQPVTWSIKSPSTYLAIDTDGGLSVKTNISGSVKNATGAPYNLIQEYVVATNAFGASSEVLVPVQVTANALPVLSYTGLTVVSGSASATGETVGTVTATDPQSLDSITSIAITGGTDAAKFALVQTGATSYTKTYNINAAEDLDAATYQIELTATDSFNKQAVDTKTITVTGAAAATETIYVYGSTRGADSINSEASAISALGDPGADGVSIIANSPLAKFIAGDIGTAAISVPTGKVVTLIKTGSLSTLTDLDTLGNLNFSAATQQVIVLFPSGSAIGGQPSAMWDSPLPAASPQAGRYALYNNNSTIPGVAGSGIYYFNLDAPKDGYSRWGMIFSEAGTTANAPFHIIPDSGSTP